MSDAKTNFRPFPSPKAPVVERFQPYEFDFQSINTFDMSGYLEEVRRFEAEVFASAEHYMAQVLGSIPEPSDNPPPQPNVPIAGMNHQPTNKR